MQPPRRRRVSGALRGRRGAGGGFVRNHRRDHVAAVGFDRRVDQHLEEHVALRVAAAEQADLCLARRQQIDNPGMVPAPVRLGGLAYWDNHIGDRGRGPQRRVGGQFAQRGNEAGSRRVAPDTAESSTSGSASRPKPLSSRRFPTAT